MSAIDQNHHTTFFNREYTLQLVKNKKMLFEKKRSLLQIIQNILLLFQF